MKQHVMQNAPYNFVDPAQRRILEILFAAVPKAQEQFERGEVADAFQTIREWHITLKQIDLDVFLCQVLNRMPSDYQYLVAEL